MKKVLPCGLLLMVLAFPLLAAAATASSDYLPERPREVSRLLLPTDEYPHWLALEPGGDRLVITGNGALASKVRFATIDRSTGKLTLRPETIDFTRKWPDGWNGSAMPHGAVFSNP